MIREREKVMQVARQAADAARRLRTIHSEQDVFSDYDRDMCRIAGSLLDFACSTLTEWYACTAPNFEATANGVLHEWGLDELC